MYNEHICTHSQRIFPLDDIKLGTLILIGKSSDDISPLPLKQTNVNGQVTGPVAVVEVEQIFINPFKDVIELEYLFPLPEKAAVVDYTIRIGERDIKAEIQEKEAARRTYQRAIEQGNRASLLEQRRPNLFSIQIGNVQPGEDIITTLTYEDRLSYSDGAYEFVFPMGITPKYHTAGTSQAEAEAVDRPFTEADETVAPSTIHLTVDAGVALASPISPTHDDATLTETDDNRFTVDLTTTPNKDFRMQWTVSTEELRTASWGSKADDGETYLITLLPPRLTDTLEVAPREFIFVLDRSGSMNGAPIKQAVNALRACIRALDTKDTFTIQAFDDRIEWFSKSPQAVTQANVDSADRWLDNINSRGGTEIVGAIREALAIKTDNERTRYVVFLTDGAVSAEERVYEQITKKRGNARLFSFGIGSSVNRALLVKMAELGRGTSEFLGNNDDIEGALIRFQDRVSYPVLHDIDLEWKNASGWDTYPAVLPDIYVGDPLEITTKLARTGDTSLVVKGKLGDEPVSYSFDLPHPDGENATIGRLWARSRIESLGNSVYRGDNRETVRQQIITLGLQHRIATQYTSFVAVDSEETDTDGDTRQVTVSGALPDGLDADAFVPSASMTYGAMAMRASPSVPQHKRRSTSSGKQYGQVKKSGNFLSRFFRSDDSSDDRDYEKSYRQKLTPMSDEDGEDWFQEVDVPPTPEAEPTHSPLYDKPIEDLDLSDRVFNALKRTGITSVGDVHDMLNRGPDAMLAIRNFGEDSLDELEQKLREKNYLPDDSYSSTDDDKHISVTNRDDILKQYARTQNVNGSWNDSVEMTAAVVLTFVREGHTARTGNYRRQVKKALDWLKANATKLTPTIEAIIKIVIAEHEGRTLTPADSVPSEIKSLDDLRRVALNHGNASAPKSLIQDDVARAWLAVGKPRR